WAGLDLHVDRIWARRRNADRNAAERAARKAGGQLRPRAAGIVALPERAAWSAAVEAAARAASLIAGRIDGVAVRRIDRDVGEPGVVVDELDLVPRLSAVGRLEDAALGVRSKEVTGRGDVHDFRVGLVDHDARDRLRFLQTDVRERLAAVDRLVDAVTE